MAADFVFIPNTFPKLSFVFNPFTSLIIPKQGSILPKRGSIITKRFSHFPKRGSIIPKRGSIFPKRGLVFALECSIVIKACTFSCWHQQYWWNTWRHLLKPFIRPDWLNIDCGILKKGYKKANVHSPNSLRSCCKGFRLLSVSKIQSRTRHMYALRSYFYAR